MKKNDLKLTENRQALTTCEKLPFLTLNIENPYNKVVITEKWWCIVWREQILYPGVFDRQNQWLIFRQKCNFFRTFIFTWKFWLVQLGRKFSSPILVINCQPKHWNKQTETKRRFLNHCPTPPLCKRTRSKSNNHIWCRSRGKNQTLLNPMFVLPKWNKQSTREKLIECSRKFRMRKPECLIIRPKIALAAKIRYESSP